VLYAWGSLAWFGVLLAFFVSSTFWSKWKKRRKEQAEGVYAKGGRRDAGQVMANGGLAALLCLGYAYAPHPLWWGAFVGVMAAVNADTWATELGGLSRTEPRSIVSGRRVPPGTSGGVTPLGLAATLAGGLFIGAAAWLLLRLSAPAGPGVPALAPSGLAPLLALGALGGVVGSLADSLLGATAQVMYRCGRCGREVERREHCGQPARHVRGWRPLGNDAVNVLGSAAGAAACAAAVLWLGG
jgi:uncharacterized protein (TIGR00297 family)